jgi:hypothetical protein
MAILNAVCTNSTCRVFLLNFYGLDETPSFCPVCGAGIIQNCPRCHMLIKEHGDPSPSYCDKCGQRLRFNPDPQTGMVTVIVEV